MGQEILQLCFGVGNLPRKTDPVELVQPGQVSHLKTTQLNHTPGSLGGLGDGNLGRRLLRLHDHSVVGRRGQQPSARWSAHAAPSSRDPRT